MARLDGFVICVADVEVTAEPWGQRVGCGRDLDGFLVELLSPAAW